MATSVISSAAVTTRAAPRAPATTVASLKPIQGFPVTRKPEVDITSLARNSGRTHCMKVWPPLGKKKFETLSYLPTLSIDALAKEIDYLLKQGLIPCIEFDVGDGFVSRENNKSPGYYDGRYWTMWKLPMFGCTDSAQVIQEIEENKKEYPDAFIRVIGFDNKRQVQIISFIVYKPPRFESIL